MVRTITYTKYVRSILLMTLLLAALTACSNATPTASTTTDSSESITFAAPVVPVDGGGPGIDQSKLDVCALLPRDKVEAAIGTLVEAPKPGFAVGNEVGCNYEVDQGRSYEITVFNLDRWELISQLNDNATATSGIGDEAFVTKEVGGGTALYVLLRDRAVIGARVNGADTPPFRQLLDLALTQVR